MFKSDSRIQTKKEFIQKLVESGPLTSEKCSHLNLINSVTPSSEGCEDCLKIGDRWVHLRVCLICGHVGCCNDSKNKHATKHFHATKHALIMSYEPKEDWIWCYLDEAGIQPLR